MRLVINLSKENLELFAVWAVVFLWFLIWLPVVVWLMLITTFEMQLNFWQVSLPFAVVYSVLVTWLLFDWLTKRGEERIKEGEGESH